MKKRQLIPVIGIGCEFLLCGVGTLSVLTPAAMERLAEENDPVQTGIGQHFVKVGQYLQRAIESTIGSAVPVAEPQRSEQLELELNR